MSRLPVLSDGGRHTIAQAAADLGARAGEIAARLDARIIAEVPEVARGSEELTDSIRLATTAHMTLLSGMLGAWTDPAEAPAPRETIESAREFARQRLPVESLLRVYRVGHAEFVECWQELLADRAADAELLSETGAATVQWSFRYVDSVLDSIVSGYMKERELLVSRAQSIRDAEVRGILRGDHVDVGQASSRLRYELERWHVGFIAWLPNAVVERSTALVEAAASALASSIGVAERPLMLAASRSSVHGWIGSRSAPQLGTLPAIDGVYLAIGEPARGVSGFRTTHEQAQRARRVARLAGDAADTATRYGDCEVASLLSADLEQARAFVAATLGPLASGEGSTERMLKTLAVFQQEELSLGRAAKVLHVHTNTVSYRIKRALELIGEADPGSLRLRAAVALAPLVRGDA